MSGDEQSLGTPFGNLNVPADMVWQYEVTLRGGRLTHIWSLKNERGAIHIQARLSRLEGWPNEWMGGIECHYPAAPDYMSADKPSHDHCWLLGKPCWHDGTSLGFTEQVADILPHPYDPWKAHDMKAHHHEYVTHVLRDWHRSHFGDATPIPERGEKL